MRKSRINQVIFNNNVFGGGVITAVNGDGTYSVKAKGRAYTYTNVIESLGNKFKVGDNVTLARVEGDNQKPCICGYGAYAGETAITEVER